MSTLRHPPPATDHPARPRRPVPRHRSASVEPLLRRLHFYAGVLVAPFLVIAALTGLAYAFAPQLDQIAYRDQMYVAGVGDHTRPLSEQVATAQAALPEGTVRAVVPPDTARHTTRVEFDVPELGSSNQRTVYVDPYTAEVRGTLTTSEGNTPLVSWISTLHEDLHLGEAGRLYSEMAASWLLVLVLGGALLWWRQQRGRRALRRMLHPHLGTSGVRRTRSWHASLGAWLAVALLVLSVSGLVWSSHAGARFTQLQDRFDAHTIIPDTTLSDPAEDAGPGQAGAHHATPEAATEDTGLTRIDTVLGVARNHGLRGPVEIAPAPSPGQAWLVTQTDNRWPLRKDAVAVDPYALAVTDEVRWADQPILAQRAHIGIYAHTGVLFGPANQVLLAVTMVGLLVVILWGYWMWWQRRPTRADRRRPLGSPPPREAWRRLPIPLLILGVPAVVVLGWAVPLLGWSLLGFLLLDVCFGLVPRRRPRRRVRH